MPGQHLSELRPDQQAQVTTEFIEAQHFEGRVKRISPVVDPTSGTFRVTIGLENREDLLRPGLFVNVQVITDTHQDAVLIPRRAIVSEGGVPYVFVIEQGTARKIELDAGYEDEAFIESLSKIQPGVPVIVVGQNGLRDDTPVRVGDA